MGIRLVIEKEDGKRTARSVPGAVAHLGRRIPKGKQGVVLTGEDIANHHGKIFYAYNSYCYVNLTSRPTWVFRGPEFSFALDPFMPQCELFERDRLKIGTVMVEITELTPPRPERPPQPALVTEKLTCRYLQCPYWQCAKALRVVRETSGLADRLRDYENCHEILRASVDWLVEVFSRRGRVVRGLRLGSPEAVAIRPRPGAPPAWPNFELPVDRGISREEARVANLEESAIPIRCFDSTTAFRFQGRGRGIAGIGAGIREETTYAKGIPRAGHLLLLQYPRGKTPTSDDLCLCHHVATHISQLLANVHAARLRQESEMERQWGTESQFTFHDMNKICASAQRALGDTISLLTADRERVEPALNVVQSELENLRLHIERSEQAYGPEQEFRYGWVDLVQVARTMLVWVFKAEKPEGRTRDWRVRVLHSETDTLPPVPCDKFSVERILQNLVNNARRAIDNRGADVFCKRVHVLLDRVRVDGLPYARVRVVDNGPGMKRYARNTIFEGRFTTKSVGHGLGTQIVAEQVRKHCGSIEVASERNQGTVISVMLPAPAVQKDDTLADTAKWLEPYRERLRQKPLVTRWEWGVMLRGDEELTAWYEPEEGGKNEPDPARG
jgi:signal transduction histidine kinase